MLVWLQLKARFSIWEWDFQPQAPPGSRQRLSPRSHLPPSAEPRGRGGGQSSPGPEGLLLPLVDSEGADALLLPGCWWVHAVTSAEESPHPGTAQPGGLPG